MLNFLLLSLLLASPVSGPVEVQPGKSAVIKVPLEEAGAEYSWRVEPETVQSVTGENKGETFLILLDVDRSVYVSFVSFDKRKHVTHFVSVKDPSPPSPGPVPPPPGPGPQPPGPQPPAPISEPGFRVLIVYESEDKQKYSYETQAILYGVAVRTFLDSKCVKDDGKPAYRMYDKDVNVSGDLEVWKKAMARERKSTPWVIISNGTTGFEGPLPSTPTEFLELCKKYLPQQ